MAIQLRRGVYTDFNPDNMVAGEIAVVSSGDPNTSTGASIYVCYGPGNVQRFMTQAAVDEQIDAALGELEAALERTTAVEDAVETVLTNHPEWRPTVEDGSITDAKLATCNVAEVTTRENIVSGESRATIFGKIKKWFTDLAPLLESSTQTIVDSSQLNYNVSAIMARRRGNLCCVYIVGENLTLPADGSWCEITTLNSAYTPSSSLTNVSTLLLNNGAQIRVRVSASGKLQMSTQSTLGSGSLSATHWYFVS